MSDWSSENYYRDERLADLAKWESALENARAARMAALQEALLVVLREDLDVMDADSEVPALRAALIVVNDLRRTW